MAPASWLPRPVAALFSSLAHSAPVWLVGGAVRDTFLGRETGDLDFVTAQGALALARRVADQLGGHFYSLDKTRGTGRVILVEAEGNRRTLDFSTLRGPDITSDLRTRDFTINAMAVAIDDPERLIDPCKGLQDLKDKWLRTCSPQSISDDPVRALRAVRLADELGLRIAPETLRQLSETAGVLSNVSAERVRDELMLILGAERPGRGLRILDHLGLLSAICPELAALRGLEQPARHALDAWEHTLSVVDDLGNLLLLLGLKHDPEAAADLTMAQVTIRLGRFREQLTAHLDTSLSHGRRIRQLLFFSALLHDVGKPPSLDRDADGHIRFIGHEEIGARLAVARARALRLSSPEVELIRQIVRYHMLPSHLAHSTPISPRAVYRFFRQTGNGAVGVILLSLADLLGTYGPPTPQDVWETRLGVARTLLEAYFEGPRERLFPPPLLRGDELAKALELDPGPEVGKLLELIREAQASGEVRTRDEALSLARRLRDAWAEKGASAWAEEQPEE